MTKNRRYRKFLTIALLAVSISIAGGLAPFNDSTAQAAQNLPAPAPAATFETANGALTAAVPVPQAFPHRR